MKDRKISKNNTSGFIGVNWSEEKQKWHAKIGVNYARIHLGYFSNKAKAVKAYEKAKLKYRKAQ